MRVARSGAGRNPGSGTEFAAFAVAAPGLEAIVVEELEALGIPAVVEDGGASFHADASALYATNLHLRTASRVLVRVAEFRARTFHELERRTRNIAWERFVGRGRAVRLRVTCRKSRLYHEGAVAERLLAAIDRRAGPIVALPGAAARRPDQAPGKTRAESLTELARAGATAPSPGPSASTRRATAEPEADEGVDAQLFVVRFLRDVCTISADASGALLHVRGYRQALAKAPLRETLAAALLRVSGWDPARGQPLLDPFCGSGTIPIEAALLARRIAPGLANADLEPRAYAFQAWPEHDAGTWAEVVESARSLVLPAAGVEIRGSDRDAGAVAAARANAGRAGVGADVVFEARAISAVEPLVMPAGEPGRLITNPPYGVRVGERDRLRNLYAAFGRVARERFPGWAMTVLSADRALQAQLKLPLAEALRTRNGGIPVRVLVGQIPD